MPFDKIPDKDIRRELRQMLDHHKANLTETMRKSKEDMVERLKSLDEDEKFSINPQRAQELKSKMAEGLKRMDEKIAEIPEVFEQFTSYVEKSRRGDDKD